MTHGSLFSGIGGFDLASRWMGWQNVFTCEIEEFPRQILKHHFPEAIHYEDIKRTDFSVHHGQIDVLTGGFPCQPFSTAGKRLGKHDERHLWPEMFRAIREIQPRWIVGENVRGFISWSDGLVLDEVYADLESEGYEVQAFVLPAAGINAPHKRDRVWIVAHSESNGSRGASDEASRKIEGQNGTKTSKSFKRSGLQFTPNASGIGCGRRNQRPEADQRAQWKVDQDERQHGNGVRSETTGRGAASSDSDLQRGEERHIPTEPSEEIIIGGSHNEYAPNANSEMLEHRHREGAPIGSAHQAKRIESSYGAGNWEAFPTQSPVCGGDDGLPNGMDGITFSRWRRESIKAYGNAIVPQIAYRIFETIKQTESSTWI